MGYRGLDKASAEAEADICATQLFKLLRERDVNGRDFMGQQQNNCQQTQSEPLKDADGYPFLSRRIRLGSWSRQVEEMAGRKHLSGRRVWVQTRTPKPRFYRFEAFK